MTDTRTAPAGPTGNTYDKYASSNPVERRLLHRFLATLDDCLPASPPARVLEVGAGEGEVSERVLARYPSAALVAVDLPDVELARQWTDRRITGLFGDITRLPFSDDTFDLVLAIEVLEHVPDPEGALRELARVGHDTVVVSVPLEPLWRIGNVLRGKYVKDLGNTPGHIQHWGRRGFSRLVGRHLETMQVRSPLPWTMIEARVPTG